MAVFSSLLDGKRLRLGRSRRLSETVNGGSMAPAGAGADLPDAGLQRSRASGAGEAVDQRPADQAALSDDLPKSRGFHVAVFAVSVGITFFSLFYTVSGRQVLTPGANWIGIVLWANLGLIGFLGYVVWHRIRFVMQARRNAQSGARLHVRLAVLLAAVAVFPAGLVLLITGITNAQATQAWFSAPIRAAIDITSAAGDREIERSAQAVRADLLPMADDLNAAVVQLRQNRPAYRAYLASQAGRRGFVSATLLRRDGTIIERVVRPEGAPDFVLPSLDAFTTAGRGDVAVRFDERAVVHGLFKLASYPDTYLSVTRLPEEEQVALLERAAQSISAYRRIEQRQGAVQQFFLLAYSQIIAQVMLGAAWLGLTLATRISSPIGTLAAAAERVGEGDLSVQVKPDTGFDEISVLAGAFNRMTTEIKSQQDELLDARTDAEERSAFIEAVLDGVGAGIVSLGEDGSIKAMNGSAARLLGQTPERMRTLGLTEIAPEFAAVIAQARPGMPAQKQVQRTGGGVERVFDVRATCAGDDLVVTFDDVSTLFAAQRQAAWKDVARRIAHEIKNPLTPIQLSAERLRRKYAGMAGDERATFEKMTDTIVRQVTDIGRMVDEFSAFARMPTPRFEPADLAELVRQACFTQRIASPDIEVTADTPPEAVTVAMDQRLIAQALANLLKNSAESVSQVAIPQPGEPPFRGEVHVAMWLDARDAHIAITDNGIGLPDSDRRRLLEPYVTTRSKGTGLGLAIVSRIMEEHHGTIDLDDRNDGRRGACVQLRLPLHIAGARPQTNTPEETAA
jgi:two-component system, NtrC family, nitrogen regulation sensor histidine kinase NtrY